MKAEVWPMNFKYPRKECNRGINIGRCKKKPGFSVEMQRFPITRVCCVHWDMASSDSRLVGGRLQRALVMIVRVMGSHQWFQVRQQHHHDSDFHRWSIGGGDAYPGRGQHQKVDRNGVSEGGEKEPAQQQIVTAEKRLTSRSLNC